MFAKAPKIDINTKRAVKGGFSFAATGRDFPLPPDPQPVGHPQWDPQQWVTYSGTQQWVTHSGTQQWVTYSGTHSGTHSSGSPKVGPTLHSNGSVGSPIVNTTM